MPGNRAVAVVTGASSGIGAELARIFAAEGHELVLVARREEELTRLADGIGQTGLPRPHVLPLDLARMDGGARLAHELAARGLQPTYVINNAGFGLAGPAAGLDRAEQLAMIDLNVRTLTDLSLRFADGLAARRGGILNVASVAGFLPGPGMAVYFATKAFVLSFTEALHHELAPRGVRVTVLCPGPVPTPFHRRAGLKDTGVTRLFALSAERVAAAGYEGLMAGKRLVVPGLGNKAVTLIVRLAPRALMLTAADARRRRREPRTARWRG